MPPHAIHEVIVSQRVAAVLAARIVAAVADVHRAQRTPDEQRDAALAGREEELVRGCFEGAGKQSGKWKRLRKAVDEKYEQTTI